LTESKSTDLVNVLKPASSG